MNVVQAESMQPGGLPPGPTAPPWMQQWRFLREPLRLFDECHARYGDIFRLDLGKAGTWVFLCHPDQVKTLYQADPEVVRAGEAKARLFGPLVGRSSSLVADGAAHLARRRLLLPAFHGERMLVYTERVHAFTARRLGEWRAGAVIESHGELKRIALDTIVGGVFGPAAIEAPLGKQLEQFAERAMGSRAVMMPALRKDLGPLSPWGRVLRVIRETDRLVHAEIARRRGSPERGDDIMSMLLDARDEEGQPLSDQALRDELITMVVAGHEITGMSLAWALAAILAHPEVHARVRDEVQSVVGDGAVAREHVPKLVYLEATLRESLRLYSAVVNGSARRLSAPFELGGHALPAGTIVSVCTHRVHRRADTYPDPLVFRPDRWFGVRPDPYSWVPFGGGMRRCLGMAFALHEMKVVLATVLAEVDLALVGGMPQAIRRGAFFSPAGGARVRVVRRLRRSH